MSWRASRRALGGAEVEVEVGRGPVEVAPVEGAELPGPKEAEVGGVEGESEELCNEGGVVAGE